MKRTDQVIDKFVNWKDPLENSSGQKLKVLHTDNKAPSAKFTAYLKKEVDHEFTLSKTPQHYDVVDIINEEDTCRSCKFNALCMMPIVCQRHFGLNSHVFS